jgi:hypothetical protein
MALNTVNDIDDAFVLEFESYVHVEYERMGAQLTGLVRTKPNVVGKSTTFQKIGGQFTAGQKSRNGQVPITNARHEPITCTIADYYLGHWVDELDELKIIHEERAIVAQLLAAAMGRQEDAQIVAAAETTSITNGAATGGVTKAKVQEAYIHFGDSIVPGMERYLAVSPQGWVDLMNTIEFANEDYVPKEQLPFPGYMVSKFWHGFYVFQYTGLTKDGSNIRTNLAWQKYALGRATQKEMTLDVTWQGKEQSHLFVEKMACGAVLIDEIGVFRLRSTES